MQAQTIAILAPVLFVPLFAAFWLGITALLAHLSGWTRLAQRFGSDAVVEGEHFRFASAAIGAAVPVSYRNCLSVTVGRSGFSIRPFFAFRFRSPPLFIPWTQVAGVSEQQVWLVRAAVVSLRDTSVQIKLAGAPGDSLASAYSRYSGGRD